jgi:energy-coupling factor transporter ATP-binding protein EcfA2
MQTPLLFSGSIADNIRYGKLDATMDEIVAAAKEANCHEFITSLPGGYESGLGEGGAQLSGGERQRIAVARAFIRAAPILILDEPTSAIDSKTEAVILDALENLMEGRTSFMIAHRLSTVRNADLILVLNHGEVVEHGTHEQLLAKAGLYYQLYEAQTGRAAAIEAQYAQQALTEGDSQLGVSDILAEVATAEALARYEKMSKRADDAAAPDVPVEPHTNGAERHGNGAEPDQGAGGLKVPLVPQPGDRAADPAPPPAASTSPPAPKPPAATAPHAAPPPAEPATEDGQPHVSERVVETLTDAVRQRIRQALSEDTVPNKDTDGSNGVHDQDGPGPDRPGSSPFSAGNDTGV